jgi:hypothetical protein
MTPNKKRKALRHEFKGKYPFAFDRVYIDEIETALIQCRGMNESISRENITLKLELDNIRERIKELEGSKWPSPRLSSEAGLIRLSESKPGTCRARGYALKSLVAWPAEGHRIRRDILSTGTVWTLSRKTYIANVSGAIIF